MTAKLRYPGKTTKSVLIKPAIVAIILVGLAIVGLAFFGRPQSSGNTVQFRDIHGLGFSSDGKQLIVPAHDGFRIFVGRHWLTPHLPVNDYMGYSAVDDGFYSSGHPGPGSNLVNPLGLIRSTDEGQTFTTLDFKGESDFHLMSVGYHNHAIYVLNPSPNSRLSAGLYYSLNEGQNWKQSRGEGISGSVLQIAAHPVEIQIVAVAAEGGVYLSNDYGNTFTRIMDDGQIRALAFAPDGERLLFGYQSLSAYDMATGQITSLRSPAITGNDAISYIAMDAQSHQMALATFNKNIYLSPDDGQEWKQIAEEGTGSS